MKILLIIGVCLVNFAMGEDVKLTDHVHEQLEDSENRIKRMSDADATRDGTRLPEAPDEKLSAEEESHKKEAQDSAGVTTEEAMRKHFVKKRCCVPGFAYIDLRRNSQVSPINTMGNFVSISKPTFNPYTWTTCSNMAVLKVNFEKLTSEPCGSFCLKRPECGRRMLKIDLELSWPRWGYMFNVGDSGTNDAWSGDSGTQQCDAEVHAFYPHAYTFGGEANKCNTPFLGAFAYVLSTASTRVTLYVSNEHIRITNDQGFDQSICHRCLFCLNGQTDTFGSNEIIYLGLNRVIGNTYRYGYGVCSATLTWECPCCEK